MTEQEASTMMTPEEVSTVVGDYKAGWHDPENSTIRFDNGLSEQVVRDISALKDEPEWMTEFRVKAYRHYEKRPMPTRAEDRRVGKEWRSRGSPYH